MPFQSYVQLTMLDNHLHQSEKKVKLMERSIFSARYCFVENMYRTGKIIGCEYEVLDEWFKFVTGPDSALSLNVDLIIYLRTTPEKALERINVRARSEENTIPLEYIQELHSLHEDWLVSGKYPLPAPVLVIDADKGSHSLISSAGNSFLFSQDLAEMQDIYKKHEGDVFGKECVPVPEESVSVKLSSTEAVLAPQSA